MNELKKWLASERNWHKGVELYKAHGKNPHLKRQFERLGESPQRRQKLEYELQKLVKAPPAPRAAKKPQKTAKKAQKVTQPSTSGTTLQDLSPNAVLAYANPKVQAIQFDTLPEELKPAYLELIDHEKKARMIHWEIRTVDEEEEHDRREKMAHDIVFAKDRVAEIYERLDHWVKTGEILSTEKPSLNVKTMTDMELLKKEKNLKSSVSRFEKNRIPDIKRKIKTTMVDRKRQIEEGKLKAANELLNQHRADLKAVREEIEVRDGKA